MSEGGRYRLEDRYLADEGTVFLTGIQALARLPLEQLRADRRGGLRTAAFVSGYPGSPLGGYDGAIAAAARLAPELPIVCRPAMNEEYGASAVMGSQLAAAQPDCRYDGIVGLWYGKAPGVDRASDALRHAVYAGTSMYGGAVAIVGDDPAAKSSTVPSSSAGVLSDMHVPLFYPGDPAEALDLGRHAIALSRATGLWTALKIVADVADATASVSLHPERITPIVPIVDGRPYAHHADGNLLTPRTIEVEREIYEVRYQLAREYAAVNRLNQVTVDPPDAWIGLVSSGITYREVREALARLGLASDEAIAGCGIRMLKMNLPMPFEPGTVRRFAKGLEEVFVVEEKRPGLESLVKDALYGVSERPRVVGKQDEAGEKLVPGYGALDADALVPLLRRRLARRVGDRLAPPRPRESAGFATLAVARTPFFCSGCPHNRSTQAPHGSLVGAGIGCHTMALLMDPERVGDIGGLGCMGNEGVQWIGMSPFVERPHFFQNLGDGTFFHSGQLAIQASIAAGVNVTYKLLYNGAVAMTGGQHPEGQLPVPAIVRSLLAEGVAEVLVTTDDVARYHDVVLPPGVEVWPRERLLEAQERLAKVRGTTVLIHDQACAAELRRARKRGKLPTPPQRVVINHRLCEGCGDCGQVSNCLSVEPFETPFGRKTRIDQTTCNLDYSCLEGDCPSFMTVTLRPPGRLARWLGRGEDEGKARSGRGLRASRALPPPHVTPDPPEDLPAPRRIVPDDEYAMRITGIGGTGVVTVAQVIGTAAMLDGYFVRGLDQIGLSQKAGPVVSDLRLSRSRPTATNRLGEGQADLLLAFDQLVAASEKGLLVTDRDRTTVVGSTSPTPTGDMITHPEIALPSPDRLAKRLADATRSQAQFWADAEATTEDLFGDATTANIFVVGMALQAGCLPVSPERLEEAIRLNGVAIEANVAAFRWGRAQVADPEAVAAARRRATRAVAEEAGIVEEGPAPAAQVAAARRPTEGARLTTALAARVAALGVAGREQQDELARYASELVAWGGEGEARRWLAVLERVRDAEEAARSGSRRLVMTVGAQLFKLMAYKDEYEVARLMLDADGLEPARELAGRRGRIAWKLHPPILRALGLRRKIGVPFGARPLVRLLARLRFLRGSVLDPFGYAEVRRVERALPGEYEAALDRVLPRLSADRLDEAIALAALPDGVRGYEDLKLERAAHFRTELAASVARFGAASDQTPDAPGSGVRA
ncbi:MAG: indolepyruvate ferredoxin oxidoreductase family protein [Spirochaetaceae bacterium]|nr:indolepyruvate ferredoxin oxidoreductase family protein [Spirochaetaceae bacterium]